MEFDNIKEFAEYLGLQRGLSAATVKAYRYDLRYYAEWLSAVGKTLSEVGPKDLEVYIKYMFGELQLQPKTGKRRMAAISTYYKWLVHEEVLKSNPVYNMVLPKARTRLPVYLLKDEIKRFENIFEEEAQRRPIVGVRNRALMYLMMFAGLRISEALTIREADVTMLNGVPDTVTVIGKGNKERQVPLSEKAARAVGYWLDTREALRVDRKMARMLTRKDTAELESPYLFPGRNGRMLSKRHIQAKLVSLRGEFGGKKLTPHKLRHTFATSLFREGIDIKTTKELLGHASIATTEIYTHVEASQMRAAVKRI